MQTKDEQSEPSPTFTKHQFSSEISQAAQTELGKPRLLQNIIGEGFTSQLQQSYLYEQQLLQQQQQQRQQQQLEGSRLGGHLAQLDTGQLAQSPQVPQICERKINQNNLPSADETSTQIFTRTVAGPHRGGRRADLPEPRAAPACPAGDSPTHWGRWRADLPEPSPPREVAAAVRRLGQ